MYVSCVYPAMLKSPKQLPNCLKRAETNVVLIVFMVSSVKSVFILFPFLSVAQHEPGTRKAISWSGTVYNKHSSNQCNWTVQKEPVEDKL